MAKRQPVTVPEALLTQTYSCPDCVKEGVVEPLPGSEFNWATAPRYAAGVRRQTYCKRHQSARNGAAQKKRLQQPEAQAARREYQKKTWKRYMAKRYAQNRAYYARKRVERRAAYDRWAAENPERRKASRDAWRARQKLRSTAGKVRRRDTYE